MKKTITLILLIFISYPYVNAQCGIGYDYDNKNITDLEKRNLNGKVKSVTYSHYDIVDHFGEISKGSKNCEQEMFFNRDSTVSKIIESDFQFPRKDVDIHEYEKGEIKLISHYNKDGILSAKTAYITEGNDIREQRYLSDGELNDQFFLRSYDLNGNMVKEIWKYHNDPLDTREKLYYYDKNNRIIEIRDNYSLIKATYGDDFAKHPVKIENVDSETDKTTRIKGFEFDSNGNTVKKYFNGKLSRNYEYEYDEFGNWTKKIEFKTEGKIPEEIIERIINYYE